MSKISMFVLVVGLVIGITGVALFLYGTSGSQSVDSAASISNSQDYDGNSSGDGIKVHGDWELTVSDQDGSNAVVYNFENQISIDAIELLSRTLLPLDHEQHLSGVDEWTIELEDKFALGVGDGTTSGAWIICEMNNTDRTAMLFVEPYTVDEYDPLVKMKELNEQVRAHIRKNAEYIDIETGVAIPMPTATSTPTSGRRTGDTASFAEEIRYQIGITLTGSCLAKRPEPRDDDNPIEIDGVYTSAYYANQWIDFSYHDFLNSADNPQIISQPGQLISATVNFTFER